MPIDMDDIDRLARLVRLFTEKSERTIVLDFKATGDRAGARQTTSFFKEVDQSLLGPRIKLVSGEPLARLAPMSDIVEKSVEIDIQHKDVAFHALISCFCGMSDASGRHPD